VKDGDIDYIKNHNPAFLEATWKFAIVIEDTLAAISTANPKPKKTSLTERCCQSLPTPAGDMI